MRRIGLPEGWQDEEMTVRLGNVVSTREDWS